MKLKPNERKSVVVSSETNSIESASQNLASRWHDVLRRRSFLQAIGVAGTPLVAGKAFAADNNRLTSGDAALLRLAAAIELIEADLWQQYNELGGAVERDKMAVHRVFSK